MRPQGIKRWNKVEQLIRLANPMTAQVEKKNQKTLTPEWMETNYLEIPRFGSVRGFDQESEDIWKRELPCDLKELFESITKGKDQTVSKMIFNRVEQQLYLQPKRINVHRLQTAVYVSPKCLTFFGSS
ncbi:hypothetical protein ElyMa_001894300 [Elysia marginata]|uniref:Uncharacterized protein n=1 Tax=Elysia marginata TaxID=1093978 RepID=A0AAV4ETB3_9GAST|nr:hypothetical protein ElyMa_001894300 [Elysia marginata]